MAQLRDARTSALIAEGTPTELVLAADELGHDQVLFDDVGEGFDPDAVRQAYLENVAGLEAAAASATKETDAERLQAAADDLKALETAAPLAAHDAMIELEAARALVGE